MKHTIITICTHATVILFVACAFSSANTSTLQEIIDAKVAAGDNPINIPKGTYYVNPTDGIHLRLHNIDNNTINFNYSKVHCTETTRALDIRDCNNFVIKNLRIDYDPLPFAQYKVTWFDPNRYSFKFDLISGYDDNEFSGIQNTLKVFDPSSNIMRRQIGKAIERTTSTGISGQKEYSATFQLHPDLVRVNDIIVVTTKHLPSGVLEHNAVHLGNNSNLELNDVYVYGSSKMGFFAGSNTDLNFINCRVQPCDPAYDYKARGHQRLQSAARDGFHLSSTRGDTLLDNCRVKYNDDDCIAIYGKGNLIESWNHVGDKTHIRVVDNSGKLFLKVGDPCALVSFIGQHLGFVSNISSVTSSSDTPSTAMTSLYNTYDFIPNAPTKVWDIVLDKVVNGIDIGTEVYPTLDIGSHVTIQNCKLSNTRSRGILMRGSYATITGCEIKNVWQKGILCQGDHCFVSGGWPWHVSITNNSIESLKNEAIYVAYETLDGYYPIKGLFKNITITGNTKLKGGYEADNVDVRLWGVKGYTLNNNTYPGDKKTDIQNSSVN